MIKIKYLLVLLFLLVLPFASAGLNSDFDGNVPVYVSEYLNNGTDKNAIGDYRTVSHNWSYSPQSGEIVRLARILITIGDAGISDADNYGGLGSPLDTGISFWIEQNGIERRIDGNLSVKTNGDFHRLAYDVDEDSGSLGSGLDYVASRWSFDKSGTMLRLNGDTGDRIFINLNDTFVGLDEHYFLVQGYKELQGGDSMGSIAITLFMLFVTLGLYILPFAVKQFTKNQYLNLILKRSCWVLALYLTMFTSAIMATIAESAGLNLTNEMFRMMWLFGIAGYLFMGFLVLGTLYETLKLYKIKKEKREMGEEDE